MKPAVDAAKHAGIIFNDSVAYVPYKQAIYLPPAHPDEQARCLIEIDEIGE